jgi:CRP-like cAMP-binding protein
MGSGSSSIRQSDPSKASGSVVEPSLSTASRARQLHKNEEVLALEEKEIAIRSIPLFENIEQKSATLIASILILQKVRSGQTITVKGAKFDSVLVLKSGIMIVTDVRDGFETNIDEYTKPLTVCGEHSFQNESPSELTLKTKTECTMWKLDRKEFVELFKVSVPSFLESQRRRYKSMQVQLEELDTENSRLPFKYKDKLDPLTRRVILSMRPVLDADASHFPQIHSDVRWDRRVRVLENMKRGCPVDIMDERQNSLLIVAVQNGHLELARMFLELGAQINIQNDVGATALHYALEYDYPRIATLLKANGADDQILDAYGGKPAVGFTNRNSQSLSKHLPRKPIAKPHEHQAKSDFVRAFMMSNKLL